MNQTKQTWLHGKALARALLIALSFIAHFNLHAGDDLAALMPVRGFCIAAPTSKSLDTFVAFIEKELAPRHVNTLILRVDYRYQYKSRPEMTDNGGLSREEARKLTAACRTNRIR